MKKSDKIIISIAAFFALTAVVLGAMGAHMLRAELSPQSLASFKTGVHYQFMHALALMIITVLPSLADKKMKSFIAICFVLGVCCFSGSIYFLSTKSMTGFDNLGWLGPITPIGGLFFITGWLSLFLYYLVPAKKEE